MKLKTITARVLECLLNTTEDFVELASSRRAAYRHLSMYDKNYEWTETKLGRWIESLKQERYIRIIEKDNNRSIELTNKGKIKIIDQISSRIPQDCVNRFISFDIPETLRKQRNGFRKAIKEMGFIQIQQSLWAINKNVGELVHVAENEFGVKKYVAYIISSSSDIDELIENKLVAKTK